jgi:hypothetical protein
MNRVYQIWVLILALSFGAVGRDLLAADCQLADSKRVADAVTPRETVDSVIALLNKAGVQYSIHFNFRPQIQARSHQ